MHEGVACHHIVAIIDIIDVAWPFVVTTYPSFEIVNN